MRSQGGPWVQFVLLLLGACFAHAQTGFQSLGTWSTPQPATCANGFYGTNCYSTVVTCPGTTSLSATYGYKVGTGNLGTIVMFTGGGGTSAGGEDYKYASDYWAMGYGVVQVVWASDWENTGTNPYSMKNAACRPATFLQLVYTNPAIFRAGKFCAQGGSGGAGALGYSLAWYGAGSGQQGYPHLDNVELIDGPMFSDLKQGCAEYQFNDSPDVPVCKPGTSQLGCTGWGNGIDLTPEYLFGAGAGIGVWTGDASCTVGQGTSGSTSPKSNRRWLDESIVSPNASFSYPNTNLAGWLCETVNPPPGEVPLDCTDNSPDAQFCLNNSTSQGQIFFSNFTSSSQFLHLTVNAIQSCQGSEGVGPGIFLPTGQTGMQAIESDMATFCQ